MLALKQHPFSHKDEMAKILNLEKKTLGSLPGLEKYLSELDSLKSQFGFEEGKSIPAQKSNTTSLQEKMEQYIKILFNVAFYFDVPLNKPIYAFFWKGSVQSSGLKLQNFYYEIAGVFYNYSTVYFNQGLQILESGKPDELKLALRYFRQAMWGFLEASKAVGKCLGSGTPVSELSPAYIRVGYHVAASMGYNTLYRLLRDSFKTFTADQRRSFHKNAYHDYFKALKSVEETQGRQFAPSTNFRALLSSHKCFHLGSILLDQAREYEKLQKDTLTGGHIGIQIALLENLRDVLTEIKPLLATTKNAELVELAAQAEKEVSKLKQLHTENEKIYKAKIPERGDLPQIPESEYKINPLDQPHVKTIIEDLAQSCSGRKSGYFKTLENDFDLLLNKNKQTLNVLVETSEKHRIDLYQKNNIDVILRMALATNETDMEIKTSEIIKIYGGLKGYTDLVESLQKALAVDDLKASELKLAIEQDFANDRTFYNQTGFRVLGLKESGNQILPSFEKHGITLTELKQKDTQLIAEFSRNKDLIGQIEKGNLVADLKKVKESLVNSEELQTLIKKHQIVADIFRMHIKPKEKALFEQMNTLNSRALISEVFFNKKTTDEIYAELNENVASKIEDFRNMIDQVNKALEKIVELSRAINKSISSSNSNAIVYQQKIISDINSIYLLYSSLLNNLEAHANLQKNAECLEQILKDHLLSKDLQKQDIMKNAQAFRDLNLGDFLGSIFEKNLNVQFWGKK